MPGVIADAVAGLKTRLETISGLTVYDYPPDAKATKYPAAFIELGDGEYEATVRFDYEATFDVTIMVKASRESTGWEGLEEFLDRSLSTSVHAAIDGDRTLGGKVDWARLEDHTAPERDEENPSVFSCVLGVRWYKSNS